MKQSNFKQLKNLYNSDSSIVRTLDFLLNKKVNLDYNFHENRYLLVLL